MYFENLVSIVCTTYNHENYIANTIEGFLIQKTNFKFEILIHDDASTDQTANIIKLYEKRYPELIKAIYQKENQYSKGLDVSGYNIKRALGKYIAICEGDDFWTDPLKLQKQIDFLENNPEYSLCVHAAKLVNIKNNRKNLDIRPSNKNRDFSTEEVISGGGGLFPTNSMVFLRKKEIQESDFSSKIVFGDYALTIYLSLLGKVYYMDEFMSVYRLNVEGSWSSRVSKNRKIIVRYNLQKIKMLDLVNIYTKEKYNNIIVKKKLAFEYSSLVALGNFRKIINGECREIYNSLSFLEKVKLIFKTFFVRTKKVFKIK